MKKVLSLIFCMLFTFAIFLTGCGTTLTDVKNEQKGIVYNGGNVAVVSDYLFFANGFTSDYSSMADMDAYNTNAKHSNLSRVKLGELANATTYASSDKVETVSQNDVTGFGKTYMFAYGDYVYYVAPNTHKTNENKQAFDNLTVFKVKFNGTGRSEIYTTKASFDSTNGKIVALEYNGIAYIMIYDGQNFVTLDITNGGTKVNLESVTSVAFPQENADWNGKVYFTMERDESIALAGNDVYEIKVDGTEKTQLNKNGELSKVVKFIGRYNNELFFTKSDEGAETAYTYKCDASDLDVNMFSTSGNVYYYKEISNITRTNVASSTARLDGYIFTANGTVMYFQENGDNGNPRLIDSATYSNAKVICAVGTYVYFSTKSGIYKVSLDTKEVTTIIDGMTISTDSVGYTFNYVEGEDVELDQIYFFAQRKYAEETEEEDKTDTKVYMHQVSAKGGEAKLVGKTVE